ncbi:hypothetical protein NEOLEDRAFT_1137121 [Neolentinus lepideus HHB14362 ss-1]|uniref:Uncharacterized protein n=1 Tax=Neolentinus lepideus HHB14362 ss-1 TaxID=1314782 RepID=A0A165QXS6_9AGAM|nr:hypothetical protein NEOLEDRAFT_1137121 [Neolentinus lepideus HHB14362 ss-1]
MSSQVAPAVEPDRHCRWVVLGAPRDIMPELFEDVQIGYVAHDEELYVYDPGGYL